MILTITFKLTPESREEMIQSFPKQFTEFKEVMEIFNSRNGFGLPNEKVQMRWLVETGQWKEVKDADPTNPL